MTTNAYETESLEFSYTPNGARVLNGISLKLRDSGGVTFLLGENGSGKSTLIRLMLAELHPSVGTVKLYGKSVFEYKPKQRAKLVSYVPQDFSMPFNYTALDMVAMGRVAHGSLFSSLSKADYMTAYECMERLSIQRLSGYNFLELSGGEKKLCLIARSLAQGARIMLMDEPESELDYGNRLIVLETIRALALDGVSVLLTSHNPESAIGFADRVLAIKGGQLIADGTPQDVVDEALMEQLYGVKTRIFKTPDGYTLMLPYRDKLKPNHKGDSIYD